MAFPLDAPGLNCRCSRHDIIAKWLTVQYTGMGAFILPLNGSQYCNNRQLTANGANSANIANYGKSADRANSVYLKENLRAVAMLPQRRRHCQIISDVTAV